MLSDLQLAANNVQGLPGFYPGNAFFVSSVSGSSSNPGDDKSIPVDSIDTAIGKCSANNGDVIYVLPGHAEVISAAAGIAADVAGVSVVGLGTGTARGKITFSATGSTLAVTAANFMLKNLQLQNAIDSLVNAIPVSAAGFQLVDCELSQPTNANDALIWVITTAAGTDMIIMGNTVRQSHSGPTECIRLVGADRAKIINNFIMGSYSTAAINSITTLSAEVLIARNTICNSVIDAKAIAMLAASTGRIEYNTGTVASTAGITDANIIVAANCQLAQNYFSDAAGETGKLVGVVSA